MLLRDLLFAVVKGAGKKPTCWSVPPHKCSPSSNLLAPDVFVAKLSEGALARVWVFVIGSLGL